MRTLQGPSPYAPHRRNVLAFGLAAPLAGMALVRASGAAAQACVKGDDLTASQVSLRAALKYEDPSTEPAKVCAGCAFFTADADACGQCKLLNGPVSAKGRCSSWAARAG